MRGLTAAVLAMACAPGAPALAQGSTAGDAGQASSVPGAGRSCALHVWADPYVDTDISGIFPGGFLASLETGPYREAMKRGKTNVVKLLLTSELLMQALRESRIGPRLGIAADKFVLEPDNATYRDFRKLPASDAEGCRYGFTFQIVKFEKSTVYGRRLTVFYNIIDRTKRPRPRNTHGYNSEKISAFEPTADDEQISAVFRDGIRRVVDDIVAERFPEPAVATRR